MKRRHFSRLLAGVPLLGAPAVHAQQQAAGVALVIGNSKYKWEASLPNVKRDAPDVAKAFQALGLKTELVQDAGRDAMFAAIEKFKAASRGAILAAFYFAGHGASWDKDTFLVPEDADLSSPSTVQTLLPVSAIGAAMKEASHRLLVFDNCRNNPADGWRQRAAVASSRVQATDQAAALLNEPNTLVMYSTASGRVALDGPPGENSPFTAALLRQLGAPSVDLQALAGKLRRDLLIATECRQMAWDQTTYTAPYLIKGSVNSGGTTNASASVVELPKTYAFAREKGLTLPTGLIAFRDTGATPYAHRIGGYQYLRRSAVGQNGSSIEPVLLVVMSVTGDTAQIISAGRDWLYAKGSNWSFFPGTLSADRLNWQTFEGTNRFEFKWRTADSGDYTGHYGGSGVAPIDNRPFSRLDG